ncbi:hypothetical protein S245_057536, partial [Arachis hypogaea]
TVASSFFVVSANLSSSKVSIGSSHYYSHRPHSLIQATHNHPKLEKILSYRWLVQT